MPDVEAPTDATNSPPQTPTDAPAPTDTPSSTTPPTETPSDPPSGSADGSAPDGGDPLEGGSLLDQPEGEKPQGEGADAEGDKPSEKSEPDLTGAPEGDYDLTGLVPEGTTVDAKALEAITPTAKALNLSNAGLARLAAEAQPIVAKQVLDGVVSNVSTVRAGWDMDTRAAINGGQNADGETVAKDPFYQGKDLAGVQVVAAKAIDTACGDKLFPGAKSDGTPGTFRDFLKATGLGNHPAMMQFAFWAGSQISEDNDFHRGGDVPNTPKTREEKYYGTK